MYFILPQFYSTSTYFTYRFHTFVGKGRCIGTCAINMNKKELKQFVFIYLLLAPYLLNALIKLFPYLFIKYTLTIYYICVGYLLDIH